MVDVFFLSQVILRERLLDLHEFVGRMMILSILAALFGAISALLVSIGSNTSARLFGVIIDVIILLTLCEPLKERLATKAVELLFRERHRFVVALEDLRRAMPHGVLDPAKMSRIVVDSLYDSRRATHVAIHLLEPMGDGFALHADRGPEPAPRVNATDLPELWKAIQESKAPPLTGAQRGRDLAAHPRRRLRAPRDEPAALPRGRPGRTPAAESTRSQSLSRLDCASG